MQDDRDQFAQLGGGGDEEAFRTLIMLQLELSALRALDSQASLAQEQQLLRHAASYQRGGPPGMYVSFSSGALWSQHHSAPTTYTKAVGCGRLCLRLLFDPDLLWEVHGMD